MRHALSELDVQISTLYQIGIKINFVRALSNKSHERDIHTAKTEILKAIYIKLIYILIFDFFFNVKSQYLSYLMHNL